MWTWLASFLSGPLIKGALDAYNAKLKAGNTTDKIGAVMAFYFGKRGLENLARIIGNRFGK
jgi:hypothetical protein